MAPGRPIALAAALLALGAAGCGQSDDRDRVRGVAERFYAALKAGDGAAACEQLSADTRATLESDERAACREAIASLEIEPGALTAVEVYITNAKVDVQGGESAYLSLTADGWRLSAAGCTPAQGDPARMPLDCELEA